MAAMWGLVDDEYDSIPSSFSSVKDGCRTLGMRALKTYHDTATVFIRYESYYLRNVWVGLGSSNRVNREYPEQGWLVGINTLAEVNDLFEIGLSTQDLLAVKLSRPDVYKLLPDSCGWGMPGHFYNCSRKISLGDFVNVTSWEEMREKSTTSMKAFFELD